MMITVMLVMQCIVALHLDLLILTFELQNKQNLHIFHKEKQNATIYINLTAEQKVETQDLFFKVGEAQFDLYMRVDTNTNGHRQWFYFCVKNQLPGLVKFNIYRFKKKFSLFQRGMRPYVCSIKSKLGWKPNGNRISYRVEKFATDAKNLNQSPSYYLTFQYKFEIAEDEVYFASGIPYTVSFLNQRLLDFKNKINNQIQFDIQTVGKTLCGQILQLVSINSINRPQIPNYIIINARTHAGETSSSWVLDGLLEKIVNDFAIKKWISENNICFKIIPMLNPDGVFMGNYRTGVLGDDFNRKFATGKKQLFPQIHSLKRIVSECKKNGKVFLFLDLHGHSVLKNSFIYGPPQNLYTNHPLRNLSFSLWHNSKYFRLSSCKFKFDKQMTETARIYFQIKQNILSYTCEISLGLYYQGNNTIQMLEDDYKSLGASMVISLSQLLTKQKLQQFQNIHQSKQVPVSIHKLTQTNQLINHKKTLPKQQITTKNSQPKTGSAKRQNHRQTVIQKIKNIKKQLVEQQSQYKKQYASVGRQKIDLKLPKDSRSKIKMELSSSVQKKIVKIQNLGNITENNRETIAVPRRKSIFDPFQLKQLHVGTDPESSPVRAKLDSKKNQREAQFKIRRRSDILKMLPQSIRKKLGQKPELGFTSTKYLNNNAPQQQQYLLQRSATFDAPYLSTQIEAFQANELQIQNLQIIDQNFSDDYQSINDSDNSSQNLGTKDKQYLIQCIKNNKKLKTNDQDTDQLDNQQEQAEDITNPIATNINGFRQIRFKFSEDMSTKTILPFRSTKREIHKFRDITYKSLGRNLFQNDLLIPTMVQRKQLNQRAINKKSIREPYFLVQIKNKNL